jgi:uncharacterized membrane protein YhaH (DUF805 family)
MKWSALFRFRGRLSRGWFVVRCFAVICAFFALDAMLRPLLGVVATWLLNPLALWMLLAASTQRLHDRGYSGAWMVLGLIPVAGALWLLWQFLGSGNASDSRWGPDPLRDTGEFLVVR